MHGEFDEVEFRVCVESALGGRDGSLIQSCIQRHASFCYKNEVSSRAKFSTASFQWLINLLESADFEDIEGKHHLLLFLEYEWGRFQPQQRIGLRDALVNIYERTEDKTCLFIISELFGDYFEPSIGVAFAAKFGKNQSEHTRLFVPHALEHIYARIDGKEFISNVVDLLVRLAEDESDSLRQEAINSLRKVRAQ